MAADSKTKKTILTLTTNKVKGIKTVLVTAYDYPQAMLADRAGVDCILIGDSLGMTTLGYKTTIPVTMDDMIRSCEAVSKGNQNAFLIGDKLGGYKVQGKTADQAEVILKQALKLQEAGCSALLLEAMPKEPAGMIARELKIPVYGIGGGNEVDGQLVIFHDLVGLFWEFKSKFVKRYCEAGKIMQDALTQYADEVRNGIFPASENFYEIKEEELEKLLGDDKWKYEQDRVENNAIPNHSVTPITSNPSDIKR